MNFYEGMCLQGATDDAPITGIHRVVFIAVPRDLIVTVPMHDGGPDNWICYQSLDKFKKCLAEHPSCLAEAHVPMRAIQLYKNDEAILREYPARKRKDGTYQSTSAPIRVREERKRWFSEALFTGDGKRVRTRQAIFGDEKAFKKIVPQLATILRKTRMTIRRALLSFLRWGCTENAFLGDSVGCGAPDKERKQTVKVGPNNIAVKNGKQDGRGFVMNDHEKDRMFDFWEAMVRTGKKASDVFSNYTTIFHSHEVPGANGKKIVKWRPKHQRPTYRQFERWGKCGDPKRAARILQLSTFDLANEVAAPVGRHNSSRQEFGFTCQEDATPSDRNYRAPHDRTQFVGTGNRIVFVEQSLGFISAIHLFPGAPSTERFLEALYVLGAPKGPLGEELGIPERLNDKNFPSFFPRVIHLDHGEGDSHRAFETVDSLGIEVQQPKSRYARGKGLVEGSHKRARQVDHLDPGTNFGRQRKDGERDSAETSYTTMIEHSRASWSHAWRVNCLQPVPHLVPVEMRKHYSDKGLELKPTRHEIMRWSMDMGYIGYITPDLDELRARLMPRWKARRYRDGIRLLRPDRGRKSVLVNRLVYRCEGYEALGFAERLGRGFEDIEVLVDPMAPRHVYVAEKRLGLTRHTCNPQDVLLLAEYTLWDIMNLEDHEKLEGYTHGQDHDEARGHEIAEVLQTAVNGKAEIDKTLKARGEKAPSGKKLRAGMRENKKRAAKEFAAKTTERIIADAKSRAKSGKAAPSKGEATPGAVKSAAKVPTSASSGASKPMKKASSAIADMRLAKLRNAITNSRR